MYEYTQLLYREIIRRLYKTGNLIYADFRRDFLYILD